MRNFKITLYYIALFLVVFSYTKVQAITVTPVRSEISGNPGETVEQEVTLINEQKKLEVLYSSFANFEAQGESGSPSFVEPKDGLGTWMSTDSSIAIKPGESKTVKIKIEIPKDAEPGGHFGAVFFGTLPQDSSGKSAVNIGAKITTLILLSVNGDVKESAGLIDFYTTEHKIWYNTLPVSFVYRFRNDGGDRIKPVGKIKMHDLFYIPEDTIDANPVSGNILPGSTRKFNIDWIKNPRNKDYVAPGGVIAGFFDQALYQWHNYAFGPYFAKLNLLYGTSAARVTKTVFFFVFPWQLLICLLAILTIIILGGRKLIRRYNRHIIQKARMGTNAPNVANHV